MQITHAATGTVVFMDVFSTILKLCKPDTSRLFGVPRFRFVVISAWRD